MRNMYDGLLTKGFLGVVFPLTASQKTTVNILKLLKDMWIVPITFLSPKEQITPISSMEQVMALLYGNFSPASFMSQLEEIIPAHMKFQSLLFCPPERKEVSRFQNLVVIAKDPLNRNDEQILERVARLPLEVIDPRWIISAQRNTDHPQLPMELRNSLLFILSGKFTPTIIQRALEKSSLIVTEIFQDPRWITDEELDYLELKRKLSGR